MNIDINIVNRAYNKAGEEALSEREIEENQTRYKLIKNYYLSTILETLANTSWTSQTKRDYLEFDEEDDSGLYIYDLPIDCAKPIELVSKIDYTIEANKLYTSDTEPCLIYVSNNYLGENDTDTEDDDYPNYADFNFDPLLSEYIETKLAAKIVLKISGNQNLYQLLYSEAVRMENTAVKATFAHAHNKDKGNPYWGDTLGLPKYGEEY